MRLRSAVGGRMRWEASGLKNNPRHAAAVEIALQREAGIKEVHANPVTGRPLLRCDPGLTRTAIEAKLRAALSPPPLDHEVYRQWREQQAAAREARQGGGHHGHEDHEHGDPDAQVRKLVLGGSVLLGLGVKRLVFGAGALASNPIIGGISIAATLISGYSFLKGWWRSIAGQTGMNTDTLVGSATIASLLLRENVTALTVLWLLNLGEYLQTLTLRRTERAIRDLLEVPDEEIWQVVGEQEVRRPVAELQPGDLIAVYAGKRIPVDGIIVEGQGTINEAPITGESMPAMKIRGGIVYAGTVLLSGGLRARVERVGSDTAVGRLIQRVEQARELQAPIHTVGEQFSRRFVPASFALSIAVLALTGDATRALTMLLIACPCAAGLATPTAVSAAIGPGRREARARSAGCRTQRPARGSRRGRLDALRAPVASRSGAGAPKIPKAADAGTAPRARPLNSKNVRRRSSGRDCGAGTCSCLEPRSRCLWWGSPSARRSWRWGAGSRPSALRSID